MNPLEQLKSVLCDKSGKCCITGSVEDCATVDRALQALAEQPAQQEPKTTLQNIEDAITALKDGWVATALNTLEEARLHEMTRNQIILTTERKMK